jgi:hypothetical protein
MTTIQIMRRACGVCIAFILLLVALSPAQNHDANGNDQGVATMSVDVKVVTLPVTVRDKKGQIARNLTKDDFIFRKMAARKRSNTLPRTPTCRLLSDCWSIPA